MASRLLRASYRMVKLMTEIELNEKITNLLSENPTQQKQSRRPYARENRVKKDDRLLRIIQRYYIPHAGYVDCGFDSTTLLHSGKYIKYPKHSHCQRWMKRLTSKKTRRCTDLVRKGNEYRRLFDYRNMHPLYPVQSKKNSPPPMKGTKRYRKEQKRAAKKARRQSIAHVLTLIENLDTQARVARSM